MIHYASQGSKGGMQVRVVKELLTLELLILEVHTLPSPHLMILIPMSNSHAVLTPAPTRARSPHVIQHSPGLQSLHVISHPCPSPITCGTTPRAPFIEKDQICKRKTKENKPGSRELRNWDHVLPVWKVMEMTRGKLYNVVFYNFFSWIFCNQVLVNKMIRNEYPISNR